MQEWIDQNGFEDRNAMIRYANALVMKYGGTAGALACIMYEKTAEAQGKAVKTAEIAELPSYGEVAKVINGTMKETVKKVPSTVGRLTKQVGADTTIKNGIRDGAQFAWIPGGAETCALCITLASSGWQYMSKKALKNGHAEHIHAGCDCQYAVRFDRSSNVEGYDPNKYLQMYEKAEGTRPEVKIRALRRQLYAEKNGLKLDDEGYVIQKSSAESEMLKLAKQGNTFIVKSEKLYNYSRKIEPIDGYEDIVAHGDQYSLVFKDSNGNETNVSAKEFCDIIEQAGTYKGGKIRLIACQVGSGDGIIPTYIAQRFNTEVLAPTEIVNVDFEGNMILADDEENARIGIETGKWILFNAKGRVK